MCTTCVPALQVGCAKYTCSCTSLLGTTHAFVSNNNAESVYRYNLRCPAPQVGCAKYTDPDWLSRIRRWPPVMVQRMGDFLAMR